MSLFISLICTIFVVSCTIHPLQHVKTDGLTYNSTGIYYNGELCATLSAIEVAYDNGKIVREATFVLTSSKFNELAIPIIKLVQQKSPSMEVEVELKNDGRDDL